MNRRATIVLLLVAVLLGAFLALTRTETLSIGGEETEEEETFETIPLFEEAATDFAIAFSITDNETGDRFAAEVVDLGWEVTESPSEPEGDLVLDVLRLDAAARSLTTMTATRQLSEIESLAEYGLDSARYRLEFNTMGGNQYALDIGSETVAGNSYYTQKPGDNLVNLVSSASLDTFISFLSEPPYTEPVPTPEP